MFFTHTFTAPVATYDFGRYAYTVVYIPAEVTDELPMAEYPRLRVDAEVDDVPTEGALMPDRLGSAQTAHLVGTIGPEGMRVWYLMVPKRILDQIGKGLGDEVEVRLRAGDQEAVDIPAALEAAFAQDAPLKRAWDALTPGKQRFLAHRVATAKREETIRKRISELKQQLMGSGSPES